MDLTSTASLACFKPLTFGRTPFLFFSPPDPLRRPVSGFPHIQTRCRRGGGGWTLRCGQQALRPALFVPLDVTVVAFPDCRFVLRPLSCARQHSIRNPSKARTKLPRTVNLFFFHAWFLDFKRKFTSHNDYFHHARHRSHSPYNV